MLPGAGVELEIPSHGRRFNVTLVGYVDAERVIVTAPKLQNTYILLKLKDRVHVRLFIRDKAYAFQSSVIDFYHAPLHYLHLASPASISAEPSRTAPRVGTSLDALVTSNDRHFRALISDLGLGGCKVSLAEPVLPTGKPIAIDVLFPMQEAVMKSTFEGTVCSEVEVQESTGYRYLYGVTFDKLTQEMQVCLQSFLYSELVKLGAIRI